MSVKLRWKSNTNLIVKSLKKIEEDDGMQGSFTLDFVDLNTILDMISACHGIWNYAIAESTKEAFFSSPKRWEQG